MPTEANSTAENAGRSARLLDNSGRSAPLDSPHCRSVHAHPPLSPVDIDGRNDELKGQFVWLGGRGTALEEEDIECYIAWPPPDVRPKSIVLMITDIFGLRTGRHCQMCDTLAEKSSFVVVCPDLIGDGQARARAGLMTRWPVKHFANIIDLLCCCKLPWLLRALPLTSAGTCAKLVQPRVQATLAFVAKELSLRYPSLDMSSKPPPCVVVGFCWGATIAAHIIGWDTGANPLPFDLKGGIGFHPSIQANTNGRELVRHLKAPFILAPAGNDPPALHPGGEIADNLVNRFGHAFGGVPLLAPFEHQLHGFMTRGPLEDEQIAAAYQEGLSLIARFAHATLASESDDGRRMGRE